MYLGQEGMKFIQNFLGGRGNVLEIYHLKGPAGDDKIRDVSRGEVDGIGSTSSAYFVHASRSRNLHKFKLYTEVYH
jgi:hypothetical protein